MKVLAVSERIIRGTLGTRTAIPAFDQIMAGARQVVFTKSCSSRQKLLGKLRNDADWLTDLSRWGASTPARDVLMQVSKMVPGRSGKDEHCVILH